MTVGELKELLRNLDDDCEILADYKPISYISSSADEETDDVYHIIHVDSRLYY